MSRLLQVDVQDEGRVLALVGELDLTSAPLLWAAIAEALGPHRWLLLDLSQTSFVDSTGLSVLVEALRRARDAGGDLTLRGVPTQLAKLLEITSLDRLFAVEGASQSQS